MSTARILEGDCFDVLATLPERSVQTCITSPPYYGLRDYGTDGQIGLEETPEQYVANLVAVFREVRRVLRDDGTLWLNLGDSYAQYDGQGNLDEPREPGLHGAFRVSSRLATVAENRGPGRHSLPPGLKRKDLIGVPWMVAFALRADGWYLRSDIIWAKPNPMPESVTDRPTKAHEYLFLLSKSARYFWDADAVREPLDPKWEESHYKYYRQLGGAVTHKRSGASHREAGDRLGAGAYNGRNKRSVWTVATQPFPGAHFATFPPKLIEPCVLAGSSPQACAECGAPWERVTERTNEVRRPSERQALMREQQGERARTNCSGTVLEPSTSRTTGWQPTCDHSDGSGRCTVLDPFSGAGTTGVVALRHDRDYIGIELNPTYAQMARDRIYDDGPLLNLILGDAA